VIVRGLKLLEAEHPFAAGGGLGCRRAAHAPEANNDHVESRHPR
jgi:hypothetical protein